MLGNRFSVWILKGHRHSVYISSVQFSCSVVSDSVTPKDCNMPGLPVHHQLPEFTPTHVHWVSDAIQPSHPLSSPSPASVFPSIRVFFKWGNFSHKVTKVLEFSASALVLPMNIRDSFILGWTGWISLQSKGLSESSPTPQFKSINSSELSFLYSPTLTCIRDYWRNHSFD